jgi:hypothetical protein
MENQYASLWMLLCNFHLSTVCDAGSRKMQGSPTHKLNFPVRLLQIVFLKIAFTVIKV